MVVMGPRYHTGKKTRPRKVTIAAPQTVGLRAKESVSWFAIVPIGVGNVGGQGRTRATLSILSAVRCAVRDLKTTMISRVGSALAWGI
jgi:hypothetical protein